MDDRNLIERLQKTQGQADRLKLLQEVEAHSGSWEFHYELGLAYEFYWSWYLTKERDPELRQKFAELAVLALEEAFQKSDGVIPDETPIVPCAFAGTRRELYVDRCKIASALGKLYHKERRVKNHQKAMACFEWVYEHSHNLYYSSFIAYSSLLSQSGKFQQAVEVLESARNRAAKDPLFKDGIPPAISKEIWFIYGRWAKHEKKLGRLDRAEMLLLKQDALKSW